MPVVDLSLARVLSEVAEIERKFGPVATVADQRRLADARRAPWNARAPRAAQRAHAIAGAPVRRFRADGGREGTIVYAHGGGWRVGSVAGDAGICALLAAATGMEVASIEYPLAPERPFPAALDCVSAVTAALAQEGARPLLLAGCSAGANLVAAAAIALKERGGPRVDGLVLAYGVFGTDFDTPTYRDFGDGRYGLTRAAMQDYLRDYAPDGRLWSDPRVAPLQADLRGLPPAFLAIAEADVLADDSRRMAAALRRAGVATTAREYAGLTHGFMAYAADVPAIARVYDEIGAWTRELAAAAAAS